MRRFESIEAMNYDVFEMDDELFDEPLDALDLLAGIETSLDDLEPWQRLGDVLGMITGEAATD